MVKDASKFPIKFNSNLFIETGRLMGSPELANILRKILPKYAINDGNKPYWYYDGDDKVMYAVKQQVIWISIQQKRVHCYFHLTGTRKEYLMYTNGLRKQQGVWTTAEVFMKTCTNTLKGDKKHAVRKD